MVGCKLVIVHVLLQDLLMLEDVTVKHIRKRQRRAVFKKSTGQGRKICSAAVDQEGTSTLREISPM